jgi:hypothetical protein
MSVRALGIALKLTFSGTNQLFYPQTWAFALIVATCVSTQINYLNKVIIQFYRSYYCRILLVASYSEKMIVIHYCCLFQELEKKKFHMLLA